MEFIRTGKIQFLERLRRQIPKAVRELLGLPHLGPERVRVLYMNLGIKSKADLIKKLKSGEVGKLPRFGSKLVEKILEGIKTGQEKKKRHDRKAVQPMGQKLVKILKSVKGVARVEIGGSYRRGEKTVGDLDILVEAAPADPSAAIAALAAKKLMAAFPDTTVLGSGETKFSFVIFPQNLQVDVRFVGSDSWGAALLYFTGSKEFNVMMRKMAIEKGYLLNEYGLFENGEYIAGKTEEEVFKKLGMKWTEPTKRK